MTTDGRPQGTPGTATHHGDDRELPAILDRDGQVWVTPNERSHTWVPVSTYTFTADDDVPEWVPDCPHPRICDSEHDCEALQREEAEDVTGAREAW